MEIVVKSQRVSHLQVRPTRGRFAQDQDIPIAGREPTPAYHVLPVQLRLRLNPRQQSGSPLSRDRGLSETLYLGNTWNTANDLLNLGVWLWRVELGEHLKVIGVKHM